MAGVSSIGVAFFSSLFSLRRSVRLGSDDVLLSLGVEEAVTGVELPSGVGGAGFDDRIGTSCSGAVSTSLFFLLHSPQQGGSIV